MALQEFKPLIEYKMREAQLRNPPTGGVNALVLAAGVAESVTIPSGAGFVYFSGNADFYVLCDGTAEVPSADVTDGSASELNPTGYDLADVTSISIISSYSCIVTCSFYSR